MKIGPPNPNSPRLLIVGASARAAAMSAASAGFQPVCGDLFADVDLREIARAEEIDDYPLGLKTFADFEPAGDWMFVGALENHPRVVAAISNRHRLLGNPAEVLKRVRDPFGVAQLLREHEFPVLDVRREDDPPTTGNWLRKPLRSAAGHGIRRWPGADAAPRSTSRSTHYYQKFGGGESISATFLASPTSTRFVGATQQLTGIGEWHAAEFGYCGSIGPISLPEPILGGIEQLGRALAEEYQLRGLFGLDLLLDGEQVWLVEINPRYTASVEILEWARGASLVGEHAEACGYSPLPNAPADAMRKAEEPIVGKAIVFAPQATTIRSFPANRRSSGMPVYADIPAEGLAIGAGDPVCTVFAGSTTAGECRSVLNERVAEVRRAILANR